MSKTKKYSEKELYVKDKESELRNVFFHIETCNLVINKLESKHKNEVISIVERDELYERNVTKRELLLQSRRLKQLIVNFREKYNISCIFD